MTARISGVATGLGSMPGVSVRDALDIITDVVPDIIYVPELPARGPGADMIGRTFGVLNAVDSALGVETTPSSYRLASGEGRIMRRAKSWLAEDIDGLEMIAADHSGWLKIAFAGPLSLAASVEPSAGERLISDEGAVRDLSQALIAGVEQTMVQLRRRFSRAQWIVQIDEPWLGGVVRGEVPTRTGRGSLMPFKPQTAIGVLADVAQAVAREGATSWLHTCASRPPMQLLRKIPFDLISVDFTQLTHEDANSIGHLWESERLLGVGFPQMKAEVTEKSVVDIRLAYMDRLASWMSVPFAELHKFVVVTPACGLAMSRDARAELRQAQYLIDELRGR